MLMGGHLVCECHGYLQKKEQGDHLSLSFWNLIVLIEKCAAHFFEMLNFFVNFRFRGFHFFGETDFAEIFLRVSVNESAIDGDLI